MSKKIAIIIATNVNVHNILRGIFGLCSFFFFLRKRILFISSYQAAVHEH